MVDGGGGWALAERQRVLCKPGKGSKGRGGEGCLTHDVSLMWLGDEKEDMRGGGAPCLCRHGLILLLQYD